MWPFSKKSASLISKTEPPSPAEKLSTLLDDRDPIDLHINHAQLRLWLPEAAKIALEEMSQLTGRWISEYLREFFVVYLYGAHELLRMHNEHTGLYYVPPPEPRSGTQFSRCPSTEVIPGLGKNIFPVKIFMPDRIKADLQVSADKAGIPLSTFVREILVSHLLGHTFWAERLRTWSTEDEQLATQWETGALEAAKVFPNSRDKSADALEDAQEVTYY